MNLGECSKCGKSLIADEFDSHICRIAVKQTESAMIDYYVTSKSESGQERLIVKTLKGKLIVFTVVGVERTLLPSSSEQPERNNHRGNTTQL